MVLREARRFFRSSPLLSFSGVLVLALGIGTSTLALALLLAFSSLTYPGMRTLGYATVAEETNDGGSISIAWSRFEELRTTSRQGVKFAAYSEPINTTLEAHGTNKPLKVAAISSGFFSVFTPRLMAGRDFPPVEEGQAGRHVVILGAPLAAELFQSPQNAVGRSVVIAGLPYEVVGVAPRGFHGIFGDSVAAWVPANCVVPLLFDLPPNMHMPPDAWKSINSFYGVAATNHVSSAELAKDLALSLPLRAATEAPLHVSQGLTIDPMRDAKLRTWFRLGLLLALVFTIISSLNYSLLLLARMPRYLEEVRLKKALGATALRLMAELMVGPATMVGASLLTACLFWAGGLRMIARAPGVYGELVRGSWHAALLAFGIQVPLACGLTLAIALAPALGLLRDNGAPRTGYSSTATRNNGRLLQVTVTLQIAFCIGTWILASMVATSLFDLMKVPLGYDPDHLSVIQIGMSSSSMEMNSKDNIARALTIQNLQERVEAVPGVRSASYGDPPFESEAGGGTSALALLRLDKATATPLPAYQKDVGPGYFHTMGARTIRGTDISLHGSGNEIVINETLARELWPNDNPVGRSVRLIYPAFSGMPSFTKVVTVVGVVEDMRFKGRMETPHPTIFVSIMGGGFMDFGPHIIVNGIESMHSLEAVVNPFVAAQMPGMKVVSIYSVADRAR
ncbi:MAG: ABC transporter permease, partial [Acidobacteriaceae bacterium]